MTDLRFGAYRTTETIGAGALSTIYRAVQEPLGRVVAVKALKTQITATSSFGEQLEQLPALRRQSLLPLDDLRLPREQGTVEFTSNLVEPEDKNLLQGRRRAGLVHPRGPRSAAVWHPGPDPSRRALDKPAA